MSALVVAPVWDWWEKAHHIPVEDDMHRQMAEDIFFNGAPEGAQMAHVSPNLITVHYGKDRVRWERWRRLDAAGKLPSDYARAALKGAYQVWRPKWGRPEMEAMRRWGYPPIHAQPGMYEGMAYVDVRSAYGTLYTLYWGVEYWPMRWLSIPRRAIIWPEELRANKLARNALYGLIRSEGLWAYRPGRKRLWLPNSMAYPQVALAVVDVLHTVAWRAVQDMGAVYVMIDGIILPERNVPLLMDYLASMGLEGRVDAVGPANVEGVGAYSMPGKATRRRGNGRPFSNLKGEALGEWLEAATRRFLACRRYILGGEAL